MQRRVTPWRWARTTGALSPRPCARVAWGVALSVAAHAVVAVIAWRSVLPNEAPRPARLQVRLIERAVPLASIGAAAMAPETTVAVAAPRRKTVARSRAPATTPVFAPAPPTALRDAEAEPAQAAEAISGTVFALPRIGYGGPPVTTWMRASAPPPPSPARFAQPDPRAQAHAHREAGRAQLMAALEQLLGALQTPAGSVDGWCALDAQAQPQLDCDSSALRDATRPRAEALSGLLQAYRGMDSTAQGLSIEFSQGRYQVSLAMRGEPR
ncbi:MAG: hypothetical protein ABI433_06725 [Burkholderiaceae bacterium]